MALFKCGGFSFRKRWGRWQPRHLDVLDKSHCSLTIVGEDVLSHERTLEDLSLEANQIQDLPKALFRMHKLRRLILSDNEIVDIPDEIGNLTALEELDISKNDFRIIPDSIEKLKSLTYLDVSNNTLGEVPDAITKLSQLKTWVCNDIALGEIPPEIGSLEHLVILELRDNCLKFLPMSFSFLSTLERLDLGGNELEELPDFIGQLPSLIELWLDNNYLSTLPSEIGELSALQCLDVSENRLDELPEEIAGLYSLTDLILSLNVLHEIPEGIGKLTKLQILKLDQNEIDELTDSIGNCSSILELILTDNVIEFLPSTIGKLTKLTHLNIDRNRLFTLPPDIGNCGKLSLLSARDNQIAMVPKEIGNCRSLTVLALSGNKLENLPLSVSTLPLKALWLSQNQSQSVLKLQVEEIEDSPERVLTCFLFPQERLQAGSTDFNEIANNDDDSHSWKAVSPSAVKFEGGTDKESNLQRRGTPYPKDLRDRHPHLIRKRSGSQDSEHSHHNEHERSERKGEGDILSPSKAETPRLTAGIDNPAAVSFGIDNSAVVESAEEETEKQDAVEEVAEDTDDEEPGRKRVGFQVNIEENEVEFDDNDDVCRLQRKDTPHHLKGKRIVKDDETRLQDILLSMKQKSEDREDEQEETGDSHEEQVNGDVEDGNTLPTDEQIEDRNRGLYKYTRKDTPRPEEFKKQSFKPKQDPSHLFREEEEEEEAEEEEEKPPVEDGDEKEEIADDSKEENEEILDETTTITKVYEEIQTTLIRDGTSLGINIAGGLGTTNFLEDEELSLEQMEEFDDDQSTDLDKQQFDDEGVYVSKITPGGPADETGILNIGDKIIKVNDVDMTDVPHEAAVKVLREAESPVTIIVLREVTDIEQISMALSNEKNVRFAAEPEIEDIEIEAQSIPVVLKRDGKGLGFSIAGGKGSTSYKGSDEGVYISKISENGPADLDKRLQVGDKILSINNVDVRHVKHEEVVKILTSCSEKVTLVAYRERVVNKKMRPMSQINGNLAQVKTTGESTKAEIIPDDRREEPKLLVEEIVLKKTAGPLGLSIVGGSDHASHPFGVNEPGIFISKVNPTGQAAKTNLCVGDRLLRVNDDDMQQAAHHQAVAALISNEPEIKLLVRHDPPPPGIQEITINKKLGEKLGISIRGGAKGHPGNPFDKEDEGIFVSKVNASGAAARDGRLRVGMRMLEVNNISLLGATHVDAVRSLRTAGDNLSLIVCDGYDEAAADAIVQENVIFNPALVEPVTFSPESQSSATSGDSFLHDDRLSVEMKQEVNDDDNEEFQVR